MQTVALKLNKLGLKLPSPASSLANCRPYIIKVITGSVVDGIPLTEGQNTDSISTLNIFVQVNHTYIVKRILLLGIFVCASSGFTNHSKVINGYSNTLKDILRDENRIAY